MLKAGDVIENPVIGQRVVFCKTARETNGAYVEVEYINKPFTGKGSTLSALAHFHPTISERFEILAGAARYRLGKEELDAQAGDVLSFPPRIPHLHPWSNSAQELHVRHTAIPERPDLRALEVSTQAIVTLFGLARDGKLNKNGVPNLLQLAVLVHSVMPYAYLDGMPIRAQEVIVGSLAALGQILGYRATYPRYSNPPGPNSTGRNL